MRHLATILAFAVGFTTPLLAAPPGPGSLADAVTASNTLIEQANRVRTQAMGGEVTTAEACREVARLLPAFDEIDRRALSICQVTTDEEALAEAADLVMHGPVLQCLYVLTALDSRFGPGVGYAVVYERFLRLADDDFRTENSLNKPKALLRQFSDSDLVLATIGTPWVDAVAQEALAEVRARRAALEAELTVQERLAGLGALASEAANLLAVYLQTRLELVQAYAVLLARVTRNAMWTRVGIKFGHLAARAVNRPEDMLSVFSDPDWPAEEREDARILDPFVRWWGIFRDVFNNPKPHMWLADRRERHVQVGIDDGKLYIRGRSDPGWRRSGRVTRRWTGHSFVFTVEMGGEGTGYYRHMCTEGDNGSWVNLAFGGDWADSVFEIWEENETVVGSKRSRTELPRRRRHQGRIEYREDKHFVWGYIDDVLIGAGSVDLGEKKSFAIHVSSGDEVEYNAWFDDFDVRPP
jgi:hypothetical protein